MQNRHPIKFNIYVKKKKAEELGMVGHSLTDKAYVSKLSAKITLTG